MISRSHARSASRRLRGSRASAVIPASYQQAAEVVMAIDRPAVLIAAG